MPRDGPAAAADEQPFRRLTTWAQPTLAFARRTARTSRVLARRGGLTLGHSGQARTGPLWPHISPPRREGRGADLVFQIGASGDINKAARNQI
jgi:hypothetical protein